MNEINQLRISELTVEHQEKPLGIDVKNPRFGWKLHSMDRNVYQTAYQIKIYQKNRILCDTGRIESEESIEVTVQEFQTEPMSVYEIGVTVWDNKGNQCYAESCFETGRLGVPFLCGWVEPEQDPTPNTMEKDDGKKSKNEQEENKKRDFSEFRPAQYIRIPVKIQKGVKKARVYATAHGLYQLKINGISPDEHEFAPENTSYFKILQYQTYDVTELLTTGDNVISVILADGWWAGRTGLTGDSCQYGDKVGLLLEMDIEYQNGEKQTVTGEEGKSVTGPIRFSDLFVGEGYDAEKELTGWELSGYDDTGWKPVLKAKYPMDNLIGQYALPVRVIHTLNPLKIMTTPKGETVVDMGQVMAGCIQFSLEAEAGLEIRLEHSEVLDEAGNFYNNIIGANKDQIIIYNTKSGRQTYRPFFTYQGFRYVKVSGWPGRLSLNQIKGLVFSSQMDDIGSFYTSDEKLNRLQKNIWWSQVANTISIPTDCPQREKAGWTGMVRMDCRMGKNGRNDRTGCRMVRKSSRNVRMDHRMKNKSCRNSRTNRRTGRQMGRKIKKFWRR